MNSKTLKGSVLACKCFAALQAAKKRQKFTEASLLCHFVMAEVGQLTAVSECDLCAVAPKAFGEIVALIRPGGGMLGGKILLTPTGISKIKSLELPLLVIVDPSIQDGHSTHCNKSVLVQLRSSHSVHVLWAHEKY